MDIYQAFIFGIVQGITELFPISSLGHSVIIPKLFNWNINQHDSFFLIFLVATHTATAFVLFLFFFREWKKILAGFVRSIKNREISEKDPEAKLAWLIIMATIPAGLIGILFENQLKNLFASESLVATALMLNGFFLLGAEWLRRKNKKELSDIQGSNTRISKMTWLQAIKIGLLQSIALLPGFSRTGATLTGGLFAGLSHEDAARFAFLLATPIIAAASLLKLPELASQQQEKYLIPLLVGSLTAGIFSYLSVRLLMKYFQSKTLIPFALYCIGIGFFVSVYFLLR